MEQKLKGFDLAVLTELQKGLPLEREPFARLAQILQDTKKCQDEKDLGKEVSAAMVIESIRSMKEQKYIRRVSGFFDSERMGYTGRLCAARVAEEKISAAAAFINQYTGVTHNYLRDHRLNMWFTMQERSEEALERTLREIAETGLVEELHSFRKDRTFKIRLVFDLGGGPLHLCPELSDKMQQRGEDTESGDMHQKDTSQSQRPITEKEIQIVQVLQVEFPVEAEPFKKIGQRIGVSEEEALELTRGLQESGRLKRIGVSMYHTKVGYPINSMLVWDVEDARLPDISPEILQCPNLTHCYTRTRAEEFPYNFYTMIHARSREEYEEILTFLHERIPATSFAALRTIQELKKAGMRYFVP